MTTSTYSPLPTRADGSAPGAPAAAAPRPLRLTGIDAARGLAVLGMVAVHSLIPYGDGDRPTLIYRLSAGHASAMFAVLAGVAIAFLSGRIPLPWGRSSYGTAAALAARGVVIGVIGLLLGYTMSELGVVILPYYAIMFLLAVPLTYLSTRVLAVLGVVSIIAMPVLSQWVRPHLASPILEQLSFHTVFTDPVGTLTTLLITGEFPVIVWMSYVIVGIVIGRSDLRSMRVPVVLVIAGAVLSVVARAASWYLLTSLHGMDRISATTAPDVVAEIMGYGADGTTPTTTWWWLAVRVPHTGTPLDLLTTLGSSLLVLGLCILVFQFGSGALMRAVRFLAAPVVAIGTMSLTVYVAHIMFLNSDFDEFGPMQGYIVQVVTMSVAAVVWRATAGRGPLEGLVRAITTRVRRAVDSRVGAPSNR